MNCTYSIVDIGIINKQRIENKLYDNNNDFYRSVYLEFFKKIGWKKVASLTQEGDQYSGYVSELQDYLQVRGIEFIINRKFQESAINTPDADMSLVSLITLIIFCFYFNHSRCSLS